MKMDTLFVRAARNAFSFQWLFFSYSSFFFPPWEREWESAQDDYFAGISAVSHSPLFQNAMEQRAEGIARLWLSFHSFFRLFFIASVVFHCNSPHPPTPKAILCTYAGGENVGCTFTHSDAVYVICGHHIDSLL